ncbi:MAG: hypothetical protein OXC46_06345 [Thaumarchaeota archaeon]|nr:hypothetical protein [Nitrososphaerota archaeon]
MVKIHRLTVVETALCTITTRTQTRAGYDFNKDGFADLLRTDMVCKLFVT